MFDKVKDAVESGIEDGKANAASLALGGSFATDNRAQAGPGRAVNLVVSLVVGGLMAAFLLPIAIDEIATVDTSSWTSGASAMWEILPVMVVLAIFLFFVSIALKRRQA